VQSLTEGVDAPLLLRRLDVASYQAAYPYWLCVRLPARSERPCRRHAAEKRYEVTPPHGPLLRSAPTMLGYTASSGKRCATHQNGALMSELGQKRPKSHARVESDLPPTADIRSCVRQVRSVPGADIWTGVKGMISACVTSEECATFQSRQTGYSPSRRVGSSS
jgi:hypothetical protein